MALSSSEDCVESPLSSLPSSPPPPPSPFHSPFLHFASLPSPLKRHPAEEALADLPAKRPRIDGKSHAKHYPAIKQSHNTILFE